MTTEEWYSAITLNGILSSLFRYGVSINCLFIIDEIITVVMLTSTDRSCLADLSNAPNVDLTREMERLAAIAHNTMVTHDPDPSSSLVEVPDLEAGAKFDVQYPTLEVVGTLQPANIAAGRRKRDKASANVESVPCPKKPKRAVEKAEDGVGGFARNGNQSPVASHNLQGSTS